MSATLPFRSSFWSVAAYVTAVHLIFLSYAVWDAYTFVKPKPIERLIVKTIALGGKVNPYSTEKQTIAMAEPPPKTAPLPSPKAEKPVAAKETPKSAPEPVPSEPIQEEPTPKPEPKTEIAKKAKTKPKEEPAPKKTTAAKAEKTKTETAAVKTKPDAKKESKTPSKVTNKAPDKSKETAVKKEKAEAESRIAKQEKDAQDKAQKQLRAKQQELLNRARESIAKVDTSRVYAVGGTGTVSSSAPLLKAIDQLHVDAIPVGSGEGQVSPQEASYIDELVSRLKLLLRLPEYGDVKVKLTLERSGKVAKVAIVSGKSSANKAYIEKTLPTLTFPAFGKNFSQDAQYTFSLVLSNE